MALAKKIISLFVLNFSMWNVKLAGESTKKRQGRVASTLRNIFNGYALASTPAPWIVESRLAMHMQNVHVNEMYTYNPACQEYYFHLQQQL